MERVLTMLGLAVKAGSTVIGEEPVGAAARAKKARVILLAQDAAPSTRRRAMSFGAAGGCLCLTIPADKDQLGRALGHNGGCAMCAVTDALFASAVANKLSSLDGVKYGPAAEALALKAKRAVERRQEQARHARNLRQGKRRVHEKAADPAPIKEEVPTPVVETNPEEKPRVAPHKPLGAAPRAGEYRPRQGAPRDTRRTDGAYQGRGGDKPRTAWDGKSRGTSGRGKTFAPYGDKARRPSRPAETEKPRFSGSLPVKKGKGSKKSK